MPRKRLNPVQTLITQFLALSTDQAETVYQALGAIMHHRTEEVRPTLAEKQAVRPRRTRRKASDPPPPPTTVGDD